MVKKWRGDTKCTIHRLVCVYLRVCVFTRVSSCTDSTKQLKTQRCANSSINISSAIRSRTKYQHASMPASLPLLPSLFAVSLSAADSLSAPLGRAQEGRNDWSDLERLPDYWVQHRAICCSTSGASRLSRNPKLPRTR